MEINFVLAVIAGYLTYKYIIGRRQLKEIDKKIKKMNEELDEMIKEARNNVES